MEGVLLAGWFVGLMSDEKKRSVLKRVLCVYRVAVRLVSSRVCILSVCVCVYVCVDDRQCTLRWWLCCWFG